MDAETIYIIAKIKRNLMSIDKWLNKLWYDHMMRDYLAVENFSWYCSVKPKRRMQNKIFKSILYTCKTKSNKIHIHIKRLKNTPNLNKIKFVLEQILFLFYLHVLTIYTFL